MIRVGDDWVLNLAHVTMVRHFLSPEGVPCVTVYFDVNDGNRLMEREIQGDDAVKIWELVSGNAQDSGTSG
jgi:hypothetical protein